MISAGLAVLTGSGITARNMSMKFCSHCGHPLIVGIPPLDNMPRHICPNCHMIHYENPKIVVCSIPTWETEKGTSILLCRRAITPRHGFWTLPGGFMENDETTEQAARRETKEEAGADVTISNLFSLMNLPVYHQVHLFYLAHLENTNFAPGEESLETLTVHGKGNSLGSTGFFNDKIRSQILFRG